MIPLSAGSIAEAVGGSLAGVAPDAVVTGAVADSRAAVPGTLFVAVAGARTDGHDHAEDAVARGAAAILAARPLSASDGAALPCIVVDDPVGALGRLASWVRRDLLDCAVVGITGSSGKTTTKDMLAAVLAGAGPTVRPHNSFNTEVGLPLTVLSAAADTRYLVLEMGMRGLGHIAYLASVARPDVGVVLNVGSAHIGVVGSRDAIAVAKGELVEALAPDGTAVLNADDPRVRAMSARTSAATLLFGESEDADVRASDVALDALARPSFRLHWQGQSTDVALRHSGEHQVSNALASAAAALAVGLPLDLVAEGLRSSEPESRWRMAVTEAPGGFTVVNDAFNANPESMRAALKALATMGAGRRTWAVLGEMRELGEDSVAEHDAIGRLAVRLDISRLVCVGAATRVMHLAASNEGSWGEESVHVDDPDEAIALLRAQVRPGDVVLVKASRSVGLESVADALLRPDAIGASRAGETP